MRVRAVLWRIQKTQQLREKINRPFVACLTGTAERCALRATIYQYACRLRHLCPLSDDHSNAQIGGEQISLLVHTGNEICWCTKGTSKESQAAQ